MIYTHVEINDFLDIQNPLDTILLNLNKYDKRKKAPVIRKYNHLNRNFIPHITSYEQ